MSSSEAECTALTAANDPQLRTGGGMVRAPRLEGQLRSDPAAPEAR